MIAYVDRANVAIAKLTMTRDLAGFDNAVIGFGAGIERLLLSLERPAEEPEPIDVFFAVEQGASRADVVALMAELRRAGRSCDTDYAGRSLKGQLTQAQRLGAGTIVVADAAGFTLRRRGEEDRRLESLEEVAHELA